MEDVDELDQFRFNWHLIIDAFFLLFWLSTTCRDCIKLIITHFQLYYCSYNTFWMLYIEEYIESKRNFVSAITWHNDPHPSSRISFNDKMSVSSFPLGCSERTSASCLIPSQPILLFVRSKDLILLFPPSSFTMASILSSVKLLFANTNLSADVKNNNV